MKSTLATMALFAGLVVAGCGGDDDGDATGNPITACKSLVAETCSKFWGCFTDSELALAVDIVGNNEADCRTKFEQENCTEQMTKCDSGKTFSSAKASECLSQFKALSCGEFTSTGTDPAACEAVCE
jgi:hypothetical protein